MELLLVRHGQAGKGSTDDARKLTSLGQIQAKTVGELLAAKNWAGNEVWHSAKVRARETAEGIFESSGLSLVLQERAGLLPEDDVVQCAADIESIENNLIVVGHNPFMDAMGGYLTKGDTYKSAHFFSTGSVLHLNKKGNGQWEVLEFFTP